MDTLNVWHEELPEFDHEAIGAKYKAVKHERMTEAESNGKWERYSIVDPTFSERRSNRLRNSHVESFGYCLTSLKQLIFDLVAQRKLSVYLRRQTVRASLERGKGNRRLYARFMQFPGRYAYTARARFDHQATLFGSLWLRLVGVFEISGA